MAQFITPAQVISEAFDRPVNSEKIQDSLIESVQEMHIRKLLGSDFYDLVYADVENSGGVYDTFISTYLKPIIAQYVKYYILPDIFYEIGTTGIATIPGQGRQTVSAEDIANVRAGIKEKIELYVTRMIQYLEDNESESIFSEYSSFNVSRRIESAGGFIWQLSPEELSLLDDEDED